MKYIICKKYNHDNSFSTISNCDHLLDINEAVALRGILKRNDPDHEYVIFEITDK